MRHIWKRNKEKNQPGTSLTTHSYVNNAMNKETEEEVISRASIIFFLDRMDREGLLIKETTTGKGGKKGLWKPTPEIPDEETFVKTMTYNAIRELKSELD